MFSTGSLEMAEKEIQASNAIQRIQDDEVRELAGKLYGYAMDINLTNHTRGVLGAALGILTSFTVSTSISAPALVLVIVGACAFLFGWTAADYVILRPIALRRNRRIDGQIAHTIRNSPKCQLAINELRKINAEYTTRIQTCATE